jgi:hypothetical protein
MGWWNRTRLVATLVVAFGVEWVAGCRDAIETPSPACHEFPSDSLRWAKQENPACSSSGVIVYEDAGLIAGCPDVSGFSYFVDDSYAGLWILNTATQERRKIASGGNYPSWSPDGSSIVVAGLFIISLVDSSVTGIPGEGNRWDPAWSPDGQRIAYDEGGYGRNIHVVKIDGSDRRDFVTDPEDWAGMPSWSPDGTRIVHVRQHSTPVYGHDIYVMGSDGSALQQLTHDNCNKWYPCFSPDGRMIAFSAPGTVGSSPQIWIMTADGKDARQVTQTGGEHPTWSPDGRSVIYSAPLFYPCGPLDRGVIWEVDVQSEESIQITQAWPQRPEFCEHPPQVPTGPTTRPPGRSLDREPSSFRLGRAATHNPGQSLKPQAFRIALTPTPALQVHKNAPGITIRRAARPPANSPVK